MKRTLCILLCLALVIGLAACGNNGSSGKRRGSSDDPGRDGEKSDDDYTVVEISHEPDPDPLPELPDVGDTVTFGAYEQDRVGDNGREPLEWIVLDAHGDTALLITKYCLSSANYRSSASSETCGWDRSSIRVLLNEDFYDAAFSAREKERIIATNVPAVGNGVTNAQGGETTVDKVFALSAAEVEMYMPDEEDRRAPATEYAKAFSLMTENYPSYSGKYAAWWLRNPSHGVVGTFVTGSGEIVWDWESTALYSVCIRPCIRVRYPIGASPKAETADGLVREAKHVEATFERPWMRVDRYISIPEIQIDSAYARQINDTVARHWDDSWPDDFGDDYAPLTADYKYFVNGDILSLVEWNDLAYDIRYTVYNIRISDGSMVSSSEIFKTFGLSESAFNKACAKALSAAYDDLIASGDGSAQGIITSCKNSTLSREFKPDDLHLYLGEFGCLGGIAEGDWWAGSGIKQFDLLIAYTNRSEAQEAAAALFNRIQSEGGDASLTSLAQAVENYRSATKWAYMRVTAKEALQQTESILIGGALSIGEFLLTGTADESFLKDVFVGTFNEFVGEVADKYLTSGNELIYDLFRKTDRSKFSEIARIHANYKPSNATDEEAMNYITTYYAAQIDYATVLASYLFFNSQCADELSDYLDFAKQAAFGAVRDFIVGKLTGGWTVPKEFSSAVSETVVRDYLNFLQGDTAAFINDAKGSGFEPFVNWAIMVERCVEEVRLASR